MARRYKKRKKSARKKNATSSSSAPEAIPQPAAVSYQLTPRQDEAYAYLTDSKDRVVLYGGAKGGGKSFLLCLWVYFWSLELIKLFGLDKNPPQYPLPVGFIGRKRGVDFTKTTLETFKKIIPIEDYTLNEQDKEIVFRKKVKVYYGGLDDEQNINKFNSAEFAFIAIDQAEETDRADVGVLQASLRLRHNQITPAYKQLYTANPSECWLKQDFILGNKGIYIRALYSDNPHLPVGYAATLESSFSFDEALLRAYRDGDWDAIQSELTLIPSARIEALKENMFVEYVTRDLVTCDPSQGGDECVIYRMRNTEILSERIIHEKDTMKIVGMCDFMMREIATFNFISDSIGVGAGVSDRMKELGWKVYPLNSATKSSLPDKFFNLRSEMWFYVAELVRQKKMIYPKDEELRRQLTNVRYKVINSNGQIQLEPKELTKKRLGRSPDRADAFVMGVWAKDHLHFGDAENDFKKPHHNLQRTYHQTASL